MIYFSLLKFSRRADARKNPVPPRARPSWSGCGIFKCDVHSSAYSNRVGVLVQICIPRRTDRAVLGGPLYPMPSAMVALTLTSRLRVLSGLTSLTWASDSAVALPPLCDYMIPHQTAIVKSSFCTNFRDPFCAFRRGGRCANFNTVKR